MLMGTSHLHTPDRRDLVEGPHLPPHTEMHAHRSLAGTEHNQCPDIWLRPVAQLKNMKPRLTTMKRTPKTPKHRAYGQEGEKMRLDGSPQQSSSRESPFTSDSPWCSSFLTSRPFLVLSSLLLASSPDSLLIVHLPSGELSLYASP